MFSLLYLLICFTIRPLFAGREKEDVFIFPQLREEMRETMVKPL